MKKRMHGMVIPGLILLILNVISIAEAQVERRIPYVESFQLDTETLELEPGEEHTFHVVFEPENTLFDYLNWISTDPDVVAIEGNTAKALAPGKVWLYAESFDQRCSKIVKVTVQGVPSLDRREGKGIEAFQLLTDGDVQKIEDSGFSSYVGFIRKLSEQKEPAILGNIEYPTYSLYFKVGQDGHADFIAMAQALGLEDISEFNYSDEIVVSGSADKLAALLAGNQNVQSVRTNDLLFIVDPGKGDTAKGITLQGHADELSHFSAAQNSGLYGEGAVVAILDTGIMASHEFFENDNGGSRVAYQQCYSTTSEGSTVSVCKDNASSAEGDAYPYLPENAPYTLVYNFSHGTHVAGIAAGNGGVAPKAEIAMVAVFSLVYKNGEPYTSGAYNSDIRQGLEKILEWYDSGVNITSVNLSLGSYGLGSTTYCDSTYPEIFNLFSLLKSRGIQISASTGNERYYADYKTGWVGWPACYSNVTAVGALADSETPTVANFSNHGKIVDILAPGNYIKSAVLTDSGSYGTMSGTSQAAPMVAGTFALTSGHLGVKDGEQLTDTLIAMSSKSAVTDDVTKPVLDLTNITDYIVDPPSNLKVDYTEIPGSAVISWDAAAHAEGYEVRFKKRMDTDWTIAENGLTTRCTIADLNPDRAYDFEVRAWRENANASERLYSGYVSLSFSQNLSRPEGISSSTFGNVISLMWTVSPQADTYTIYYRESGTSDWTTADTTETSWMTSTGIESGKTYEIKVSARNAAAEAESDILTVNTAGLWQADTKPTQKAWKYASATLKWTKVPGASGYRVSRRKASESVWEDEQVVTDTTMKYTDLDGSEIVFQVCVQFPSASEKCSTASLPELPMEAKSILDFNITITAEAGTVALSWDKAAEADGYIVYMYNTVTGLWQKITTVTENQFKLQFLVSPDETLKYGIKAVKYFGNMTMIPDEMLISEITADTIQHSESTTESWNTDLLNPQPQKLNLLDSPYRESFRQLPETGFATASAPGQELRTSVKNFRPTGYTLQVPSLDLMAEVVEVPFDSGEYSVAALEGAAGMLEGSALPGKGISVLTGHNHLSSSESGPFLLIRDLNIGDLLFVTDPKGDLQVFSIYENLLTTPDNLAPIEAQLRENSLVLITCENETAEGGYANRRAILAEPR